MKNNLKVLSILIGIDLIGSVLILMLFGIQLGVILNLKSIVILVLISVVQMLILNKQGLIK